MRPGPRSRKRCETGPLHVSRGRSWSMSHLVQHVARGRLHRDQSKTDSRAHHVRALHLIWITLSLSFNNKRDDLYSWPQTRKGKVHVQVKTAGGCNGCHGRSPRSVLTSSPPIAPDHSCTPTCIAGAGARLHQPLKGSFIWHLDGDLLPSPSGWGTGLSPTSLGRMRAAHGELDGELIRWVALDPATISPAVKWTRTRRAHLRVPPFQFPFLGFCLCTALCTAPGPRNRA